MFQKNPVSKYSTFQNIWFMIKLACTSQEKKVLVISFFIALLTIIQNLLNLYVSPVILSAIENHVSIQELLFTIVIFVLMIMLVSAALAYANQNVICGRISVRCEIVNLLNKKASTTSYPNIDDMKFKKLLTKSAEYTDNNGLPNNTIHGILKDENGNIWASTNQGISFIDLPSGKITNYSSRNGLQNDEFSDGAIFKDKAGWLYFGGVSGLNYFDENKIRLREHIASLSLNSLKINNTSQNIYERIRNHTLRLDYDEPYITLGFAAHDFINNENCEFSYRIIDFADEWIYNENNPNIVITKLPPGKYKLEVKCTNGDRVWSNEIYSLNLDIAYPWWLSTTAFIIY